MHKNQALKVFLTNLPDCLRVEIGPIRVIADCDLLVEYKNFEHKNRLLNTDRVLFVPETILFIEPSQDSKAAVCKNGNDPKY